VEIKCIKTWKVVDRLPYVKLGKAWTYFLYENLKIKIKNHVMMCLSWKLSKF
jgi:hypothetical protein